ncbi:MAG: hypothetical protein HC866_23455 [Leptolyngbyaceae cyanobacterium RU_5_1]|nr:hypothetical protein [Leptolyngbyaceae cyanobacterium RU_5_1]
MPAERNAAKADVAEVELLEHLAQVSSGLRDGVAGVLNALWHQRLGTSGG